MHDARERLLFFAEDMTLAHVGRLLSLAKSLDAARYQIVFACGPHYRRFVDAAGYTVLPIATLDGAWLNHCVRTATPLFSRDYLRRAVREDLAAICAFAPDLVVGDFRLSLGISTELAQVPYAALVNGYWSPHSTTPMTVPDHPVSRWFGPAVGQVIFDLVRDRALNAGCGPVNALRREYGLIPHASLQEFYSHGTYTLYPDLPALAPTHDLPSNHRYIGPLLWEPELETPASWAGLQSDRPTLYLSLGSSGDSRLLPTLIGALGTMPLQVILATAGAEMPESMPENIIAAPLVPGSQAAARADLVVSNGGSGTLYQALAAGTPVLAIPSNPDQHLCTRAAVDAGVACCLRSDQLTVARVQEQVRMMLSNPTPRFRAQGFRESIRTLQPGSALSCLVDEIRRPVCREAAC